MPILAELRCTVGVWSKQSLHAFVCLVEVFDSCVMAGLSELVGSYGSLLQDIMLRTPAKHE
jgi:hypothetical protein